MGPCGNSDAKAGLTSGSDGAETSSRASSSLPLPLCKREDCSWYTSHYCEENILRLCEQLVQPAADSGVQLYVVFVSNRARQVPLWCQLLARDSSEPVLWDYHVLLLAQHPSGNWIYDLDSTLPFPSQAGCYMTNAFQKRTAMDKRYQQLFRVVEAKECLDYFASDRSHMRQRNGAYSAKPPVYPPLRGARARSANNMHEWIDMEHATCRGEVLDLTQMETFVTRSPSW